MFSRAKPFELVGASDRNVSVGGECPCILTVKIMRILGAQSAAAGHAPGAGLPSAAALEEHMRDEERFLFTVLEKVAGTKPTWEADNIRSAIEDLEQDHAAYRQTMPKALELQQHGAKEDALVAKYAQDILQAAGKISAEVRAAGVSVGDAAADEAAWKRLSAAFDASEKRGQAERAAKEQEFTSNVNKYAKYADGIFPGAGVVIRGMGWVFINLGKAFGGADWNSEEAKACVRNTIPQYAKWGVQAPGFIPAVDGGAGPYCTRLQAWLEQIQNNAPVAAQDVMLDWAATMKKWQNDPKVQDVLAMKFPRHDSVLGNVDDFVMVPCQAVSIETAPMLMGAVAALEYGADIKETQKSALQAWRYQPINASTYDYSCWVGFITTWSQARAYAKKYGGNTGSKQAVKLATFGGLGWLAWKYLL